MKLRIIMATIFALAPCGLLAWYDICIDPGHGGDKPGAIGVMKTSG
jgi:N-acetylmuramoyl-L-alanine amidase